MSWLWALISFFNNIVEIWRAFLRERAAKRIADAEARAQAREAALDAAQSAQTPEDAFVDEDRIADNAP